MRTMWMLRRSTARECIVRAKQLNRYCAPSIAANASFSSSSAVDNSQEFRSSGPLTTNRTPNEFPVYNQGKYGSKDGWNQRNEHIPKSERISPNIQQQPEQSAGNSRPKSSTEALLKHAKQFNHIRHEILVHLDPLPAVWESSGQPTSLADEQAREQLWEENRAALNQLRADVDRGLLDPNGRHHSELSLFLECALQNFSACSLSDERSLYGQCTEVMGLMKSWNLNLQHVHCDHILWAAAREGKWKEAAELFSSRIDPTGGGSPVPINVHHPIGLYCMARYALDNRRSAVDSVMQGVLHLSMVSPEDQTRYVLAAGTALGHAGLSHELMQYVETSLNAKRLGQPLIAAAMQACFLCHEPDSALAVFDKHLTGGEQEASVQWQWGGGSEKLLPVCRDLAIRSLGFSQQINTSKEVLKYFQEIVEEEGTMSWQAFYAMIVSCEKGHHEGNHAVDLLFYVLDRHERNPNFLRHDGLEFPVFASSSSAVNDFSSIRDRVGALELALRACNASGEFGTALACLQRFSFTYLDDTAGEEQQQHDMATKFSIVDILSSLADIAPSPGEFAATCIVSLCGAECHDSAKQLYEVVTEKSKRQGHNGWVIAAEFGDFARAGVVPPDRSGLWSQILGNAWRVMALKRHLRNVSVGKESRQALSLAFARLMRQCSSASSPSTGISLLSWFLDATPTYPSPPNPMELVQKIQSDPMALLVMTDSLLSALMEGVRRQGAPSLSFDLYESGTGNNPILWILSSIEAIKCLFNAGRKEEALALFEQMRSKKIASPDLFSTVNADLFELGDHQNVSKLYQQALSCGCLSESLCLLEMKSVNRSINSGRLTLHNRIAIEATQVTGDLSILRWFEKHYWNLKRSIGRGNVGRLLSWQDPRSADLDEIELALSFLNAQTASALPPDVGSLEIIGQAMWKYHENFVPVDKTRIPLVPRSKEAWHELVKQSLQLAEQTHLHQNGRFMSSMALGLLKLGHLDELAEVVNGCLSRGVVLEKGLMDEVLNIFSADQPTVDTVKAFYPHIPHKPDGDGAS